MAAVANAVFHGPSDVHSDDKLVLSLKGDESVELALNTSLSEFRAKIHPGQTIALGRDIAERLVQESPDSWEVVESNSPADTKDRR